MSMIEYPSPLVQRLHRLQRRVAFGWLFEFVRCIDRKSQFVPNDRSKWMARHHFHPNRVLHCWLQVSWWNEHRAVDKWMNPCLLIACTLRHRHMRCCIELRPPVQCHSRPRGSLRHDRQRTFVCSSCRPMRIRSALLSFRQHRHRRLSTRESPSPLIVHCCS